jgi:hypothetical protein
VKQQQQLHPYQRPPPLRPLPANYPHCRQRAPHQHLHHLPLHRQQQLRLLQLALVQKQSLMLMLLLAVLLLFRCQPHPPGHSQMTQPAAAVQGKRLTCLWMLSQHASQANAGPACKLFPQQHSMQKLVQKRTATAINLRL